MKALTSITVALLTCGSLFANDSSRCDDPYAISAVKRVLSSPTAMASSFGEKEMSRLGDRAAVAAAKIFSLEDLAKPANVERILAVTRAAFERPKIVEYEKDRKPDFTLILLRYLRGTTQDHKLRQGIDATIRYVKEKVAAAEKDTID